MATIKRKGTGKIVKALGSHRSRAAWMDWAHSKQQTTEANVKRPSEQTWRLIWIFYYWPSRNIRRWGFFIWRGKLLSSTHQSLRLHWKKCCLVNIVAVINTFDIKVLGQGRKQREFESFFSFILSFCRRISLSDSYYRRRNPIICSPTPLFQTLISLGHTRKYCARLWVGLILAISILTFTDVAPGMMNKDQQSILWGK